MRGRILATSALEARKQDGTEEASTGGKASQTGGSPASEMHAARTTRSDESFPKALQSVSLAASNVLPLPNDGNSK